MALLEVREKLLKSQGEELRLRFFYDSFSRASLYIWQSRPTDELLRFQFSYKESVFELKEGGDLKYGRLDEGENPQGIKRSPLMLMNDKVDETVLKGALTYLREQSHSSEIDWVQKTLSKGLVK